MKYLLALILAGWVFAPCRAQDESPPLPPKLAARLGSLLEQDWKDRPEWARMASAILRNEPIGHGRGWFTGARSRYGWSWLTGMFPGETADGSITRDEIAQLAAADFARLDRNSDDEISAADFDWSKGNPMMSGFSPSDMVFDRLDLDFNGRLTRAEVTQFFDRSGDGFDFLTMEDLRRGLDLKMPDESDESEEKTPDRRWLFMTRLLNGELGSLNPGPGLEDEAPELKLPLVTHNEDRSKLTLTEQLIELKQFRGKKPVVLIFGSFT